MKYKRPEAQRRARRRELSLDPQGGALSFGGRWRGALALALAIVLRADDLMRDVPPEGDVRKDLSNDPGVLARRWYMILLMAIRDHATSVHYHPWREDGGLAYVKDGVHHLLVPSPD